MGTRDGWIDVSTSHDGSLVKRVIEKGLGGRIPLNAHVIVHFESRLNDASGSVLHSTRTKQTPLEFCVGKGIGLRGMQQAVSCMEGEERAHILMDPQWAYGPNGMPPVVPKNCKVFIDLEVLAFEECDLMSVMGDNDEVVKLRMEARIAGKHMHILLTDKSILYGPNKGNRRQFVAHKLPNKDDVSIDQKGPYPILHVQLPPPTPKLEITVQTIAEATSFTNTLPAKKGKTVASTQGIDDLADLMSKVSTSTKSENKPGSSEPTKQSPSSSSFSKSATAHQIAPATKLQSFNRALGTVLEWKPEQHFGFISPKTPIAVSNPKVFFHSSALKEYPGVTVKGDRVEFVAVEGNKGPGSFAAKGIVKCALLRRMEISMEMLNSKPQQKIMAEIRLIHKQKQVNLSAPLSTSSPSISTSSPSQRSSLSSSGSSIPTSSSACPSSALILLELFLDDHSFYILSNFECSMGPSNEHLLIRCAPATPAQRTAGPCAVCGLDTQPTVGASSTPVECRTCQIAQRVASVRIYSISTTQQGREEDYESILDLVSACGGQIAAPLIKTEIPVPEPAPSSKPAARKSTKLVITAKELADLMSSLNFDGNDKTEIPEKEMSRWLADGVALKPHQLVAVAWMGEAEKGKFGGGILADDMGMGKTLTTISNILLHLEVDRKRQEKQKSLYGTLVICKASILDQWMEEIKSKTSKSAHVKAVMYHERKGRGEEGKKEIKGADVVITTYGMVERDSGVLINENFKWTRLILDEGHTIHNTETIAAKKLRNTQSLFRWILTGTPLQNSIFDLHALFFFLHVSPYDNREVFKKLTKAWGDFVPVLKELLPRILLRRTKQAIDKKGNPLLPLPPKSVVWHKVSFDDREVAAYKILVDLLKSNLPQNRKTKSPGNVLSLHGYILRICDHLRLISRDHADKIFGNSNDSSKTEFLKLLDFGEATEEGSEEDEERSGRLETTKTRKDKSTTKEEHESESDSEEEAAKEEEEEKEEDKRGDVGKQNSGGLTGPQKGKKKEARASPEGDDVNELLSSLQLLNIQKPTDIEYQSSKVRELVATLNELRRKDPTTKTLVFSQWTRMLDLLEVPLADNKFKFVRLQGSMKSSQRFEAIRRFRDEPTINVFLLSLKTYIRLQAGGVGLNLTAANHVMMLDMWYNPAVEEQACDRVHRIGQTKPVTIHRFLVENSVEENLVKIQATKKNLADSILCMDDKTLLTEGDTKKELLQQLCNLLY